MSIIDVVVLMFVAFLVVYYLRGREVMPNREEEFHRSELRLENIEQSLERMERKVDWLSLTPSERQQLANESRFESGRTLTGDDVKKWEPNRVVELMTKDYHYPLDEPVFDEFEYKHDHMKGNEAHGFKRRPDDDQMDWVSFHFIVGPKECKTLLGEGEVRRL